MSMSDKILKELEELLHKENKKRGPINTTAVISQKAETKPKAAKKMDHNIQIFHGLKPLEASARSRDKLEKRILNKYKKAREFRQEKDWTPKLEDYQKSKPTLKGTDFTSSNAN